MQIQNNKKTHLQNDPSLSGGDAVSYLKSELSMVTTDIGELIADIDVKPTMT